MIKLLKRFTNSSSSLATFFRFAGVGLTISIIDITLLYLLKEIDFLEVYPSQANYFLCKVNGSLSATQLTEELLGKNLFIKDLTGKTAFEEKEYVRVAVRDFNDNNMLMKALKDLM